MKQESVALLRPANAVAGIMEPQAISIEVLGEKYAKNNEKSIQDVRRRVAKALAGIEKNPDEWEEVFFQNQETGLFLLVGLTLLPVCHCTLPS